MLILLHTPTFFPHTPCLFPLGHQPGIHAVHCTSFSFNIYPASMLYTGTQLLFGGAGGVRRPLLIIIAPRCVDDRLFREG